MDYQILVNKSHPYREEMGKMRKLIVVKNAKKEKFQIEKETYRAYKRLQKDVKKEGIMIELIAAYRTKEMQSYLYQNYEKIYGKSFSQKYVAPSGFSEHHTGLAIDIGLVVDGVLYENNEDLFTYLSLLKHIETKLSQYGFILRYPKGKEQITGYSYEPWHFRYVGNPLATDLFHRGITLEEYSTSLVNKKG